MDVILTHVNADFDAVAALLAAHKLFPEAAPVLPLRLNRNVMEFLTLYQNGLPFTRWEDFHPGRIDRLILVDTQRAPELPNVTPDTPIHIIDHHRRRDDLAPHETFSGDEVGSAATLLIEQMRERGVSLNSLEATLLALGVYEDTGSLTYGATTARDVLSAAWLLEQGAVLDTVRRFLSPPLNAEQQALFDQLVKTAETRLVQGYAVTVGAAKVDHYIEQINSVAHRLRDLIDSEALFVVVDMPKGTQLVCRSSGDALDVGEIARYFGGGGHGRAAAATIEGRALDEIVGSLWQQTERRVHPIARVADLMSYGAQTLAPDKLLADVIQQLRKIGHEGYPVIEDGQVIGLLTTRDADRALEHGLQSATVRHIMNAGQVTLTPDDPIPMLEKRMVESGWGQIPVVDDAGRLLGIVTRTDLIKHWARLHPTTPDVYDRLELPEIEQVVGQPLFNLINTIARQAQEAKVSIYLVGGGVRDLLLKRPNYDIDFVVEGDAIAFAERLNAQLGGEIDSFRPFGTSKWMLDDRVAANLHIDANTLPKHIDFATSRNEFYEHPAALPTVYSGSIKLDLHRRDFTINTLAIQLSPAAAAGRILDFYGGLSDLHNRMIRVLHSLSFVDDPTRILRAVRFEQRLGFTIEPRTVELIETALPMLRRITGERVRNELALLLHEDLPERGLKELHQRGVLQAIHPAFALHSDVAVHFETARSGQWPLALTADLTELYWHVLFCTIGTEDLPDLCDRLLFPQAFARSMQQAANLVHKSRELAKPDTPPSRIALHLDGISDLALLTASIVIPDQSVKTHIERYVNQWRTMHPFTDGHTLQAMGLPPGPRYKVILERLRAAWLDGEVHDEVAEREMLSKLIEETGE